MAKSKEQVSKLRENEYKVPSNLGNREYSWLSELNY